MARIKDCSEDIATITQEAVLKQNVSHTPADIFKCYSLRLYYLQNVKCEANLQLLAATQTELNQASRLLVSVSKVSLSALSHNVVI